jgi:hypothetical protein
MAERMPALFIGHGNPMNALLVNPYTQRWASIGATLPKPKGILSVSAHWYIEDAAVTVSTAPRTIHDFGGFPRELYQVQYPAPGDPDLAARVQKLLAHVPVRRDDRWGLDHGTWSVLRHYEVAVKDGVVTIAGEARSYPDKASALSIVEDTPGVRDVKDEINVLPLSEFDDELRVRTAMAIYRDPALQKYSLDPQAPIRIVVENGNVKLYGVVDSAMDKQIAEMRAREVGGVFSVENHLLVANQ